MIVDPLFGATLLAAFGCFLIGGVFHAFSSFVMRALGRLPPAQGIAAMQSINVAVINPWFMGPFLGTAALSVLLAIWRVASGTPGTAYVVAGSLLYVIGTFLVTMLFNVPRNNALERVDAATEDGERTWRDYLVGWTAWNHVRTAAALAAGVSFTLALGR